MDTTERHNSRPDPVVGRGVDAGYLGLAEWQAIAREGLARLPLDDRPVAEFSRPHAAEDPVYFELMRVFREHSREVVPGYFTGEPGVVPIQQHWISEADGGCVLALSDGGAGALGATHLVLKVRASVPGPLRLTRLHRERDMLLTM